MIVNKLSIIGKSLTYKGVYIWQDNKGEKVFRTTCNFDSPNYKTEREAALAYDKMRISNGKKPLNILKKTP